MSQSSGSSKRLLILLAILGIGLIGLGYDRVIARPAVSSAYDSLLAENEKANADAMFTNQNVRELLGREPAETFDDTNGDTVERYSWRAGMPTKTHDLFVVYKPQNGKLMFHRVDKFVFESGGQVSKFDTGEDIVVEAGEDDEDRGAVTMGGGGGNRPPADDDSDEAESGEAESMEAESTEAESTEAEFGEAESAEAESTEAESAEAESTEAESGEAESTEAESTEAESGEAESTEAESTEAESDDAESSDEDPLGAAPSDLMAKLDKDEDGFLKGDELNDKLKRILSKADLDDDDALTFDELLKFSRGGGAAPARPGRP